MTMCGHEIRALNCGTSCEYSPGCWWVRPCLPAASEEARSACGAPPPPLGAASAPPSAGRSRATLLPGSGCPSLKETHAHSGHDPLPGLVQSQAAWPPPPTQFELEDVVLVLVLLDLGLLLGDGGLHQLGLRGEGRHLLLQLLHLGILQDDGVEKINHTHTQREGNKRRQLSEVTCSRISSLYWVTMLSCCSKVFFTSSSFFSSSLDLCTALVIIPVMTLCQKPNENPPLPPPPLTGNNLKSLRHWTRVTDPPALWPAWWTRGRRASAREKGRQAAASGLLGNTARVWWRSPVFRQSSPFRCASRSAASAFLCRGRETTLGVTLMHIIQLITVAAVDSMIVRGRNDNFPLSTSPLKTLPCRWCQL